MTEAVRRWRAEFPILETCTYLVNHSLGAMPRSVRTSLGEYLDAWERRGVRAWHEGWWTVGRETGDLLAPILGARPGTLSMHQNVTIAMAVVASCFEFAGRRRTIVLSDLEFPTAVYLFEGCRRLGADIVYVRSDDGIRVPLDRLLDAVDETVVLVVASLVLFKSAAIQDARAIVDRAHRAGAHVLLDVYQAAGAVPVDLDGLGVDFAVGGSVKWLCGGPGAAYLYVRPDLAPRLEPALVGWAAHADPFAFEVGPIRYADPPERFQSGTPNVAALYAARAGYRIIAEVGVDTIRRRSLLLTRRLIEAALARGYRVNTPLDDRERGGTVTLDVPGGARVTQALIERGIIVDYRPGAGIRIAPHFYNTEDEVDRAIAALDELVEHRVAPAGETA